MIQKIVIVLLTVVKSTTAIEISSWNDLLFVSDICLISVILFLCNSAIQWRDF